MERRTLCNASIIESRILRERGDYLAALVEAEKASGIGSRMGFTRIDCWINLGEAHYHCGSYDAAIRCFERARGDERAQSNPKVLAVCDLHLTRCFLANGNESRALEQFNLWQATGRRGSDNTFVRELKTEVEETFKRAHPPFIVGGEEELRSDERLLDFKQWMAKTALQRKPGDRAEAAKLIGHDPKTLDNWLRRNGK